VVVERCRTHQCNKRCWAEPGLTLSGRCIQTNTWSLLHCAALESGTGLVSASPFYEVSTAINTAMVFKRLSALWSLCRHRRIAADVSSALVSELSKPSHIAGSRCLENQPASLCEGELPGPYTDSSQRITRPYHRGPKQLGDSRRTFQQTLLRSARRLVGGVSGGGLVTGGRFAPGRSHLGAALWPAGFSRWAPIARQAQTPACDRAERAPGQGKRAFQTRWLGSPLRMNPAADYRASFLSLRCTD